MLPQLSQVVVQRMGGAAQETRQIADLARSQETDRIHEVLAPWRGEREQLRR